MKKLTVYFKLLDEMWALEKKSMKSDYYQTKDAFLKNSIYSFVWKDFINFILWKDYEKSPFLWLFRNILLYPVFLFLLYFFRFFFGFFGLWVNFFLKNFFKVISEMFYNWEGYLYDTKKKDSEKASKANDSYVYFKEISEMFDYDIKSYMDLDREKKYKHVFFMKKWAMYLTSAFFVTITYLIDLSQVVYKSSALYFKVMSSMWRAYSPFYIALIMTPIMFFVSSFYWLNWLWMHVFMYGAILLMSMYWRFYFIYEMLNWKKKAFFSSWYMQKLPINQFYMSLFDMEKDLSDLMLQKKMYDEYIFYKKFFYYILYKYKLVDNKYLTYKKLYADKVFYLNVPGYSKPITKNISVYFLFLMFASMISFLHLMWGCIYVILTSLELQFLKVAMYIFSKVELYMKYFMKFLLFLYSLVFVLKDSLYFHFTTFYMFMKSILKKKKHG